MRLKRCGVAALRVAVLMAVTVPAVSQKGCPSVTFEGTVEAGKSFQRGVSATQALLLDAVASGWVVRVVPAHGSRGAHDSAELATPPYRSPNPLLITTDFSFRAQDAVAWNPREFRFFTTAAQMGVAERAYAATLKEPNRPAAGAALYPLLAEACTAELQITDARIAGGTADQTIAASTVASHFSQTAHTVDTGAAPTTLGKILLLRFRVRFGSKPVHR